MKDFTQEAIERAVKGGYKPSTRAVFACFDKYTDDTDGVIHAFVERNPEFAFLDPLFWSSLGKELRWDMVYGHRFPAVESAKHVVISDSVIDGWKYQMHRFIDALIQGKTPNQFFEEILRK